MFSLKVMRTMNLKTNDLNDFLDVCLCQTIQKGRWPNWVHLQVKFERVLAARMLSGYNKKAKKSVKRAKAMTLRGDPANKIIKSVNSQMKNIYTVNDKKRIAKDIIGYYIADRTLSVNEMGLDLSDKVEGITLKGSKYVEKQEDPAIEALFDVSDREIVNALVKQNLIAAQNLYFTGFSKTVISVIKKIIGMEGVSKVRQAELIQRELSKALGILDKKLTIEDAVPKKFRGTSKDYYTGLAQTTLTRTQVFNKMNLFSQAEFKHFEFSAMMDNRTSVICRSLNGRIFTVQQGVDHMNRVLDATSTTELKKVAGWRRDLSEFGVTTEGDRKRGPGSKELSAELAKAGLSMPPLHFRCRSTIRPID
jgi:hypothetical protein